jgi:hypothetical protein
MKTHRLVMDGGVQVLHIDHLGKQSPEAILPFDLVIYVREIKNK